MAVVCEKYEGIIRELFAFTRPFHLQFEGDRANFDHPSWLHFEGDGFHGGFFRPEKAQNKRACCKTKAHVILRELAQEKSVFSLQNAGKGTDISLCSK